MRSFMDVYQQILEIAPPNLAQALKSKSIYWAPKFVWAGLSDTVAQHIQPSSQNENSIKIYAILCDCSEEEMKSRFLNDGY